LCGIGGFFLDHNVDNRDITSAFNALSRRGPDAQHLTGWNQEWNKSTHAPYNALLHTRLSVRDPRPVADQPMSNDNKDIWICYNGEVYGWKLDALELKKCGHHFKTNSDTEFILRAYEEWGLHGMIDKLRGMFALVILDLRKKKLYLIRDRMGLKPLLYHYDPVTGNLVFASLVRAILPLLSPDKRQFSAMGIDAYLTHRYIPAPNTIFHDINRLENGHLIVYDLQSRKLKKQQYWFPQPSNENWRTTLDDAIRIRLESDRPVGMFLSGGMDSGVIASRLSKLEPEHLPHAFTAAFPDTSWDESYEASELANKLGIPITSHPINMRIGQDFSRIIEDLDEPFADPSAIPTWYLSREVAKKVTVVLGGDGGDELFGGYKRYSKHLRTAWRKNHNTALPVLASWSSKGWKKLLAESTMNWEDSYSLRFSGFTPNQRKFLQPGYDIHYQYWHHPLNSRTDPREHLLRIDMNNYLPEYVLRKTDLCTMSHGLEMRAPLVDHHFYQSILSLPENIRFTNPAKSLLASHAQETGHILQRKKRGFNPPLDDWIKNDLIDRAHDMGQRLNRNTDQQLSVRSCDSLIKHYLSGSDFLSEQIIQLIILDESLHQLRSI